MKTHIHALDIPEIEQIPDIIKILDDLSVGNNVFLKGIAGTGKTTLAEKIAYAYFGRQPDDKKELPFIVINCNQYTSPIDIKGGQTMSGYKEGGMIEAWEKGKILILDEMPKLDPNTAGLLNDALAKSAAADAVIFNGLNHPVVRHPDFGCIATGNVLGKGISSNYVGNNKQDSSLLDRFSGSIYEIGFNEILEQRLIYPVVFEICSQIRKYILEYEGKESRDQDTEDIMTLRTMINMQRIYELEMLRETGITDAFGNSHRKPRGGKTLRDCLESYFMVMGKEKADQIGKEVNLNRFFNSYKDAENKQVFLQEYQKRKGGDAL